MVREKKRFENALDECVAGGLNAGTDVLMNQVSKRYISILSLFNFIFSGRTYHFDIDGTERVLSTRRYAIGIGTDKGV